MIDISQAFGTPAEPIGEFYQRPGVGYYIPLYQRDYSWSQENIDQLMEDIVYGVAIGAVPAGIIKAATVAGVIGSVEAGIPELGLGSGSCATRTPFRG